MKPSEMTNEELARELIETVGLDGPFCRCDRCMVVLEAAARLRRPTPVDDDLLKMAKDIDRMAAENNELQRRLKVAEDALDFAWMYADKLPHQWPLPERVRTKMKNALAAIRKEGGAGK